MAIILPDYELDLRLYFNPRLDVSGDDASPYGQSVTLVDSPTLDANGLVLNGTSQYATYPDVASNSLFDQLTLFCWFQVDTLDAADQVLMAKWDEGDNNKAFRLFIDATTDIIQAIISSDGAADSLDISTTATISTGSDYFVVLTWDGSMARIYLNGEAEVSGFHSGGIYPGNEVVSIGADFNLTAQAYTDGTIYQAGVMGLAMLPQQIRNAYLLGPTYKIIEPDKQRLLYEPFKVFRGWSGDVGNVAVEYDNAHGKYYLGCHNVAGATLTIPTPADWSGSNFTDSQTTIAGSPTITRNSNNVTLTMAQNDGITDVEVRRQ